MKTFLPGVGSCAAPRLMWFPCCCGFASSRLNTPTGLLFPENALRDQQQSRTKGQSWWRVLPQPPVNRTSRAKAATVESGSSRDASGVRWIFTRFHALFWLKWVRAGELGTMLSYYLFRITLRILSSYLENGLVSLTALPKYIFLISQIHWQKTIFLVECCELFSICC